MKSGLALIDSGPLIALFNSSDKFHFPVREFLQSFSGKLYTTWPVITEALHLLSYSIQAQANLLEWIERGGLQMENLDISDVRYIKDRMVKYSDIPMDMADASVMCIAEKNKITRIISIDSDFSIYRTLNGKYLKNMLSF